MTTATIEGIRTLSPIPAKGEQYLSVNLALVELAALLDIAKELDFKPELVQVQYRSGIQVHALLWQGKISDAPSDLDGRIDTLADRINTDAIHSARGAWTAVA